MTLDFIILISIPLKHRQPVHVSLKHNQDLEREETDLDPDELEELRVDSDMQRDKDDYDVAEMEEEMKEEPKCWLRLSEFCS